MKTLSESIIVGTPLLLLLYTAVMGWVWGYEYTLTASVRGWAEQTPWVEATFILGALVLYLHWFRDWL